jgi:dolichol-phosphate mannosyltransferase
MDADGTHDPKYINKFIYLTKNYNIVSTTRFSRNKNLLNDWPFYRIFLTNVRHFLVSFFLNFPLDASGAFRCFDLKKVKLKDIMEAKDDGYSFFWESLFILHKKKFKIYEQKITLPYRSSGSSKMQLYDIFYALMYLLYISIKRFFYFR